MHTDILLKAYILENGPISISDRFIIPARSVKIKRYNDSNRQQVVLSVEPEPETECKTCGGKKKILFNPVISPTVLVDCSDCGTKER